MSETKRYYWLKLKDDFFNNKEVKKLRKIAGGDTFTIIYLKMQLLSIKNDGMLKFENTEESLAEQLALELDEDIENVNITLSFMQANNLIENLGKDEFLLPKVPPLIGSETDAAERMRKMRERNNVTLMLQDVTQRKEIREKIEEKKDKRKEACPELSSEISEPPSSETKIPGTPFIELPIIGSVSCPEKAYRVTEEEILEYQDVYPNVDVRAELKKMKLWLDANPTRRKKNVKAFIARWLSKEQDRPKPARKLTYEEILEEEKLRTGGL